MVWVECVKAKALLVNVGYGAAKSAEIISRDMWVSTGQHADCAGFVCLVFRGESPGLFSTASMLEWLRKLPPPPLTGEQYGKMETTKYSEGGHCQSVLCPPEVLRSLFCF